MPSFEEIEKKRQENFRNTSPTISETGRIPLDIQRSWLLAQDCEEENLFPALRGQDGAREFFANRDIQWWRHGASGDRTGSPTRNMASSQIACINFLLPLVEIDGALTAVLRAIDDDVQGVVPIKHRGKVSPVELEWIGVDEPLEKGAPPTRGANTTSVDAFVVAETGTGLRAYLLEWKYTEIYKYGPNLARGNTETRRRRYAHLYNDVSSCFKSDQVPMESFLYEPFYQLMRLRLLADRMVREGELGVTEAKVVVVVPEGNTTYRERITSPPLAERFSEHNKVSDVFRATLKRPDEAYAVVCPSVLVSAVEGECGDKASEWVEYQQKRYGL